MKYATVCDSGMWVELACALAREGIETNYYSPWEGPDVSVRQVAPGYGLEDEGVTRIDNPFAGHKNARGLPMYTNGNDEVFIFPWLHQEHLAQEILSQDFGIFGSITKDATYLERDRELLDRILKAKDMPLPDTEVLTGITALRRFLEEHDPMEAFIKVSNFREDIETWHHDDLNSSLIKIAEWARRVGPFAESLPFRVQKPIDAEVEIGLDGFFCGGQFLAPGVLGYECKSKLYAGCVTQNIPEMIFDASHSLQDYLQAVQYNNFLSNEMRITKDGTAYLTDITTRCPIPPGAAMLAAIANLPQIMEQGSQNRPCDIAWNAKYLVEVIVSSQVLRDNWLRVRFDPANRTRVAMRNFCKVDGEYWIAPRTPFLTDPLVEMISIVGLGNTLDVAKQEAREIAEDLCKHTYQASFDASAFDEIDKTIEKGVRLGIEF